MSLQHEHGAVLNPGVPFEFEDLHAVKAIVLDHLYCAVDKVGSNVCVGDERKMIRLRISPASDR